MLVLCFLVWAVLCCDEAGESCLGAQGLLGEADAPPGGTIFIDPGLEEMAGPPWLEDALQTSADLPTSFDWLGHQCIFPVLDQGGCGSCWAVASVITYQMRWCMKTGQKIAMSVEDLVECDKTYALGVTNSGCSGGHFIPSFIYARDVGYTTAECSPYTYDKVTYPYPTSYTCSQTCDTDRTKTKPRYKGLGYYRLSGVEQIQRDIMLNGPVAAQIMLYGNLGAHKTGVYKCEGASTYRGGHTVMILGWGTESDGTDYWLVQNTWGASYHDKGYLKFRRGKNDCGIESVVAAPNIQQTTSNEQGTIEFVNMTENIAVVKGTVLPITWKTTNIDSGRTTVTVSYYSSATQTGSTLISSTIIAQTTGTSFSWTVTTPPTNTKTGLLTISIPTGTSAASDSMKIIPLSEVPTIKILSPSTTDDVYWPPSTTASVRFSTSCDLCQYRVRIDTKSNAPTESTTSVFKTNYAQSTSISFGVPSTLSANTSYYAYLDTLGNSISGTYINEIKAYRQTNGTIKLINPSKQLSITRGSNIMISWELSGGGNKVVLEWVKSNYSTGVVIGTFTTSSYEWTVPTATGLGDYRIKASIEGESDNAAGESLGLISYSPIITLVRTLESASIVVTSPTASSIWSCGSNDSKITWTSVDVASVNIKLLKSGAQLLDLLTNGANTGALNVSIPCSVLATDASNDFSIRIISATDSSVYGVSNMFIIKNNTTSLDCGLGSWMAPAANAEITKGSQVQVRIGVNNLRADDLDNFITLLVGNVEKYYLDVVWAIADKYATTTLYVPTSVSTGSYKMSVSVSDARSCYGTTVATQPVTITEPAASKTLQISGIVDLDTSQNVTSLKREKAYHVTWLTSLSSRKLSINLLDSNKTHVATIDGSIDSSALGARIFIPSCVDVCTSCYLQIRVDGASDVIGVAIAGGEIEPPAQEEETPDTPDTPGEITADIYISKPSSNTLCYTGRQCPITYTLSDNIKNTYSSLTLILYRGSAVYMYITKTLSPATTSFDWYPASDIPTGEYSIALRTNVYPIIMEKTAAFRIVNVSSLSANGQSEREYYATWDNTLFGRGESLRLLYGPKHDVFVFDVPNIGACAFVSAVDDLDLDDFSITDQHNRTTVATSVVEKTAHDGSQDGANGLNVVLWLNFILLSLVIALVLK